MSNVGQTVLTVVGTVVGAYFGYPQLGFVLGSLAGQALFPTQLPGVTGPKLTDRQTTNAQVGDPVPWIFGTDFSPGEVIWLDDIETVTNTEHQGKGGPSQDVTTFTYFQSIALGICGTYPTAAGGDGRKALTRVWENGKLVYDVRVQQEGESTEDFLARLQFSALYAETFVFYDGSEDQLPDPTIEAVRGVGRTPAYRGLCYIVYPRRQLQDQQAQRHPTFRFEVGNCTTEFGAQKVYTQLGAQTWRKPFGLVSVTALAIGAGGGGQAGSSQLPDGVGLAIGGTGGGGGGASRATILADDLPNTVEIFVGVGGQGGPDNGIPLSLGEPGENGDDSYFGSFVIAEGGAGGAQVNPHGNWSGGHGNLAYGGDGGLSGIGGGEGVSTTNEPSGAVPAGIPAGAGGGSGGGGSQFDGAVGGKGGDAEPDPEGPPFGAEGGLGGAKGDGNVIPILHAGPGFAGTPSLVMHGGGGGGGGGGTRNGDGNRGGAGGMYGGGGGGGGGSTIGGIGFSGGPGAQGIVIVDQDFGDNSPCDQVGSLGLIVAAICERVGLTAVDTSTIDDVILHGYALGRQMTARAALDPLRSVGWFDAVESSVVKFVRRGAPIVATLTTADLGAHEYGGTAIPALTTKPTQNTELPSVLRLHYFAVSRDYEFGEAVSPRRISSQATNEVDVELPVALTDQLAMEIAETLWADQWRGRWNHETQLSREWIWLEGTDPILVPVDDIYQRMRIVSIVDQSILIRKLMLVRDDDDAYLPVAVGVTPERPPTTIDIKAPTLMVLLDLPPLRTEDDDAGIYAAVAPETGGTWQGAVLFRSLDGGSNWTALTGQMTASLIGELLAGLQAPATTAIPDIGNSLIIDLPRGQPESVTFAQMIEQGANTAAIGADGRWEVIQFQTAVQTGDTEWTLSTLLRGRRGTEWVCGSSIAGDRFVLLDPATVVRLPLETALLEETLLYRPVTVGTTFESAADQEQEFIHHGQALDPFSPVDLAASIELDGDVSITWIRRDRLGQTLPDDGIFPMSEAAESYEIDVVSAGNVVRTLTSATQSAIYTASQQAADGVTAGGLLFRVYQISAIVGRGALGAVFI